MPQRDEFSPFFQQIVESPDTAIDALRTDAASFAESIADIEAGAHAATTILPSRSTMAFVLFDKQGNRIPAPAPDWLPPLGRLEDLGPRTPAEGPKGRLLSIEQPNGARIIGFWAPWAEAQEWNLPSSFRQLAASHAIDVVVLFVSGALGHIAGVAAAFGLPPFQSRVVSAVVTSGSVKEAAALLGISYATAREAVAAAAQRTGSANTPALIRKIVAAAFGIYPGEASSSVVFADILPITERQARIALHIAEGFSRDATARALGTSPAVINKEMQAIYPALAVSTAADLARLITEMQALRLFARATDNAPGFHDHAIEPSRYSVRPEGGLIAWSDYGPASGRPVLVVHSNWCCRPVPLPLVRALHERGWRPIAIDRPGFGATDLGHSRREDPFSQAVADTLQVMDELKIARIPIVAHCGAQYVHALAAQAPGRVGGVVLVSPTPQAMADGKRQGPVGAFKEAFFRSPRLVEIFFRVISSQLSYRRVEQLMRWITRGSLVDEALCDDPQFIRDRFRALRPFACGGYLGGILEELVISHGGWDFAPIPSQGWIVLQGGEDYHNDSDEVIGYWRHLLPQARLEVVPGAGRFMFSSHPGLVLDRLHEACGLAAPANLAVAGKPRRKRAEAVPKGETAS